MTRRPRFGRQTAREPPHHHAGPVVRKEVPVTFVIRQLRTLVGAASRRADDVMLARAAKITRTRNAAAAGRETSARIGSGAPPAPAPVATPLPPAPVAATPVGAIPLSRPLVPRSLWLLVYTAAIVLPLVLARLSRQPERSLALELGSSLGIVALSLLALQLALPARLGIFAPLGADVAVRLHRRLADVLLALIAAHVVVAILADPTRIELLRFFGAPWRAQTALGSVAMLGTLFATSFFRRRLRLGYAAWRGVHAVLGSGTLLLAVAHTVGVNRYLVSAISAPALALLTMIGVGGVLYIRLWRPARLARRPYVLDTVIPEAGGVTTLELRAHGHSGARFRPGQFAWLKLGDERFGLSEHPFSYSSSADRPDRPAFTIKSYEGFSADADLIDPGTQIVVDGPHGAFRISHRTRGLLLVAGGIGITPCMSILRTAAERGDQRHYLLLYGSRDASQIVFATELAELAETLALTVVHVLATPPAGWTGDTGFIDSRLLHRRLPSDLRKWSAFVCGPPPMVASAVTGLAEVGIPSDRIHAEQFVEV